MTLLDTRILVVFGAEPGPCDAVLAPLSGSAHATGCSCCATRSPMAAALDRLFLQRVRGEVPWFTRVVLPSPDPAVLAALQTDPVLFARYRLG